MKEPFEWDNYSDQPALLTDKKYKKKMRKLAFNSLLKTILLALIILPLSILAMPFVKRKEIDSNHFFSMGIDFERNPSETLTFINELGVQSVMLRFKLWEMDKLDELKQFILQLEDKHITLKILQDREHIEDLTLLQTSLNHIFTTLNTSINIYEIGSTTNRTKWGFFSVDEYNRFYQVAYDLQQTKFQNIKLIGSGVIDFEYHFTAHTLFNFFKFHYDGIASLLYVDRRGAPENAQMGFTLSDKIALLCTMAWLSPKTENELHITETNWPISGTTPYAPTSEKECVSEELYSDYMLRFHFLAFASQQVNSISWHQLIAAGYGLVDNRGELHKRKAFASYQFMVKHLQNAQFLRLDIKRDYYILQCLIDDQLLQIHWSLKNTTLQNETSFDVYSSDGTSIKEKELRIGSSPLYIFIIQTVPKKVNCL
jgi:hypothetical protein